MTGGGGPGAGGPAWRQSRALPAVDAGAPASASAPNE